MAGSVLFRFYAELNDFLTPGSRQRDMQYDFVVSPSVKDAIEALGIPHTEVDVILVNGEPVDFSYRLRAGDRISVFPVFEAFDITEANLLRSEPLRQARQARFVVDTHLGSLARYLRLLGFDTEFDNAWTDEQLASISAREGRILLTRDRGLLKRREITHGLFVHALSAQEQAKEIVRRLQLEDRLRPFSRCTICNGSLEDIDKKEIAGQFGAMTRDRFEEFRRCARCGRIYWKGSHYDQLVARVEEIRAAAGVRT